MVEFNLMLEYSKLRIAYAPAIPGTFSPPQRVSESVGKTFPAFPAHAQPVILRIWQEAHGWNDKETPVDHGISMVISNKYYMYYGPR